MGPNVKLFKELPSDAHIAAAFAGAIPIALVEPTPVGEILLAGAYVTLWWVTGGLGSPEIGIEYIGPPASIEAWAAAKQTELADPYLIVMDPNIPYATEGEMIPYDFGREFFPLQEVEPTILFRLHPEAKALIAGALMRADASRNLQERNRQGCENRGWSNGSLCSYAAYTLPASPGYFEGHIAILVVSGKHVYFLVLNGTFRNTMPGVGEGQWIRVTDNVYYDKTTLFYKCAWWMANRVSNGHGMVPEQFWLDAGTAWDQWQLVKSRYGFVVPIATVPLPPNPFQ
jgi:hypothetical protein